MARNGETPEERIRRIQDRINQENAKKRSKRVVNQETGEVRSAEPDPFKRPTAWEDAPQLRRLRETGRNRNPNKPQTTGKRVINKETGEITYEVNSLRGYSRRSVNANDLSDVDLDQPDVTGDLISLSVKVDFNEASWSRTYLEIEAFEHAIHAITFESKLDFNMAGKGDTWDRYRAKHFAGVYQKMNQMGARAKFVVPPLWPMWRAYVSAMNEANFDSSGLPVGGWAPHDATYGAFRGPATTLVRTGKLKFSLTGGLLVDNVSGDSVSFGTRVEYAKFHQYGTREMPARKIVFEPEGAADFFGGMIGKWIATNKIENWDIA